MGQFHVLMLALMSILMSMLTLMLGVNTSGLNQCRLLLLQI